MDTQAIGMETLTALVVALDHLPRPMGGLLLLLLVEVHPFALNTVEEVGARSEGHEVPPEEEALLVVVPLEEVRVVLLTAVLDSMVPALVVVIDLLNS